MRIAIFTEIFDCGGIDTFIVNLINHWPARADNFVIIANANYPGLNVIESKVNREIDIVRHSILIYPNVSLNNVLLRGVRKLLSPILRYMLMVYEVFAFRRLLLKSDPDVLLVVNGGYPGGDSCRAAAISWGLFSGKGKSIHNFHNLAQSAALHVRLQENVADLLLCRNTSHFVTVSRAAACSMVARSVIWGRHEIAYIHNGIELEPKRTEPLCDIRREMGIADGTPLCLMLGTYEPRKGHYFLFRAFKKVLESIPNARLLVCGYGLAHEIALVQGYLSELQLEGAVHLLGFRTDVPDLIENVQVVVVASQAYESFGFTAVEAMAHRVPVVATNVGGIPEVVVNGEGGYCVNHGDWDLYARHIILLLKDERLRHEQGEKGYERYLKYFSADRMAVQYSEMIRQVAEDNSALSARAGR